MRILFTGATSLAGGAFYRRLIGGGHDVVSLGRRGADVVADLSGDLPSIPGDFDALVHFAAAVPLKEREATWDDVAPVNVHGLCRLLEALDGRIGRVLLASSCAVYGEDPARLPVREGDPVWPESAYALSKYAQEQLVSAYCAPRDLPWVALRLGYVYGPGTDRGRAIVKFLGWIQEGRSLTLQNATTAGLHLVHVDDIAAVGEALLQQGQGIYNLASDGHVSLRDYVSAAMDVLGANTDVGEANDPEAHTTNWYSIERLAELGIRPTVTLRDGIRSMLEAL